MRISDGSSDVCSSDLHRRGIREILERRCGLVREAVGREFRVANFDLLEILDAPEVPVHADGAEIEGRHTERFGADLGVPAVEAAKVEIGFAVRKLAQIGRASCRERVGQPCTSRWPPSHSTTPTTTPPPTSP